MQQPSQAFLHYARGIHTPEPAVTECSTKMHLVQEEVTLVHLRQQHLLVFVLESWDAWAEACDARLIGNEAPDFSVKAASST